MSHVLPLELLGIEIACPYCGTLNAALVMELREDPRITCELCGKESELDRDALEQQISALADDRFDVVTVIETAKRTAG